MRAYDLLCFFLKFFLFAKVSQRSVTGNLDPQDISISKMLRLDARQKILPSRKNGIVLRSC